MRQYVGVILVKPDGSVLAQHRDNKPDILQPDTWCAVGGARDSVDDINLKTVAQRELREETGYVVPTEALRFLARDHYVSERGIPVELTILWAWYDGVQPIEHYEGQDIRFIGLQEINNLRFAVRHEAFLRKAMEKAFVSFRERKTY